MALIMMFLAAQFWPIHLATDKTAYVTVSLAYDDNVFRYSDEAISKILDGKVRLPIKSIDDFRMEMKGTLKWKIMRDSYLTFGLNSTTYARNTEKSYQHISIAFSYADLKLSAAYTPYKLLFYTTRSQNPLGYHSFNSSLEYSVPLKWAKLKAKAVAGYIDFEDSLFSYITGPFYAGEVELIRGSNFVAIRKRIQLSRDGSIFDGFCERGMRFGIKIKTSARSYWKLHGTYRNRRFSSVDDGYTRIDDIYSLSSKFMFRANPRVELGPFVKLGLRKIYRRFQGNVSVGRGMPYREVVSGFLMAVTI